MLSDSNAPDALVLADQMRAIAKRAADMLENLDEANLSMRSASAGVLPDGTPVEDMMEELREVRAELASLHNTMRQIRGLVTCKAAERAEALSRIRMLVG